MRREIVAPLMVAMTLLVVACGGDVNFPEDQRVEGPFEITTDWQTVKFDVPLAVNREGLQRLHLVVDDERYTSNSEHDLSDLPNQANVRREDGVLIKPEVVLVGANGEEVPLRARANTSLYEGGLTIGFSTYDGHRSTGSESLIWNGEWDRQSKKKRPPSR